MDFLKKLTKGKSAKDTAMGAAKAVGLDPQKIIGQMFQKFAGGQGKGMNLGMLTGFLDKMKVTGGGVDKGFLQGIFDNRKDKDTGEITEDGFKGAITDIAEKKYEKEGIKGDKAKNKLEQQIIDDADLSDWGIDC